MLIDPAVVGFFVTASAILLVTLGFSGHRLKRAYDEMHEAQQWASKCNSDRNSFKFENNKLIAENAKLSERLKANPINQSLDLTDFLRDQSQYGYSFVRVDPTNVFIQRPRGE